MQLAWEIVYPVGMVLLFAALLWGFLRYRKSSRREEEISEAATRELYKHPDEYEAGGRQILEDEAELEKRRQQESREQ